MATNKPNPEGQAFEELTRRLLAVPHEVIKKAEEEAKATEPKRPRGRPKKDP